jgi:cell division transport system permease protein
MSLLVIGKRIIKTGFINFWRNGVVSLASVLVFTVTLFIIGLLIMGNAVIGATLAELRDKVDVTVSFSIGADDAGMKNIEARVTSLPEVKETIFKSREKVLEEFREEHKDDALILQSIDELDGVNPFLAELTIKAKDPSQYESIVSFLKSDTSLSPGGTAIIDHVNFENEENRAAIERFSRVAGSVETLGFYIGVIAAIITILVIFNTIRLGIYTAREEISVMRLVGANNMYIRGPFVIEGIIYGLIGAFFTLALLYPITSWVSQSTDNFYGGIDLFQYYISHFPILFGILVGLGVLLGIISSALAVRRYLKV